MTVPTWPGAPRQWDLHEPDRTGDAVAPLDEPLDPRVPTLLLGLVVLVALLVVPLGGAATVPDAPATVVVVAE
jgi:hypothetical protein